jgi:TolB protein
MPRLLAPRLLSAAALCAVAACGDSTGPAASSDRVAFASRGVDGNWDLYSAGPGGVDRRRLTTDPADDLQPAFSPDRRRVVFYSSRAPGGVFVMPAEGGGTATLLYALPQGDRARSFTWAPDGRRIAFEHEGRGIVVMQADGTEAQRLGFGSGPAWSPDGATLAYWEWSEQLYLMNADGSARRLIGRGREPAWSPDGQRLAFETWTEPGGQGLFVSAADGSGRTRVTTATDRNPVWSPDGTRLAFEREAQTSSVNVIRSDGTGLTLVSGAAPTGGPTW